MSRNDRFPVIDKGNVLHDCFAVRDHPIFRTVFKILTPLGFSWPAWSLGFQRTIYSYTSILIIFAL